MRKEYNITITPDGKVSVEVKGIKGKKCMDFINFLEQENVGRLTNKEYTEEYYAKEEIEEKIKERH